MRTFKDLEVWKKCRQLRQEIWILVKSFPTEEKYRLSDQMIRSSRSPSTQIAEGYGRYHFQENVQFCRIARGSLYEDLDHLSVCIDSEYITSEKHDAIENQIYECIRLLNGYINYLIKSKNESQNGEVNDEYQNYEVS
jgi:four helix bundle protein